MCEKHTGLIIFFKLENYNNLPLSLFLQVDYKKRICIDILLMKDKHNVNKNLISVYFSFLFIAFDKGDTEFYQKMKFLNYDFRQLEKPENMFNVLKCLMNIFHQETTIF